MAKKRVFIGSARESKASAETIAQHLSEHGYESRRWWREFRPGDLTLDRLKEIARSVDAAVFICTNTDRHWYRDKYVGAPRDNVILEYGIFLSALGRNLVLLAKDSQTKLPTDLDSLTYELMHDDVETVAERIRRHLDRVFAAATMPAVDHVDLVCDRSLVDKLTAPQLPAHWHQRELYVGLEGARTWLSVVEKKSYRSKEQARRLHEAILESLEHLDVRTVVSLGPGDSLTDLELVTQLAIREPSLKYLPVDISDGLLELAVARLSEVVHVPRGVLGDFEDGLPFIHRQVESYGVPPILFSLLGNTLGNLDKFEARFLTTISKMMDAQDYLLLSVSLLGEDWSRATDRRTTHQAYSPEVRRFICSAIARRTGRSLDETVSDFEAVVGFGDGGSDVPESFAVDLVDTTSENRPVISVRRYRWGPLLAWLKEKMHFTCVYEKAIEFDAALGYGVVLLQRE